MRRLAFMMALFGVAAISFLALSTAQDADSHAAKVDHSKAAKLAIVPLVIVKPGESKELTLSTWCIVGATRGGGFGLTEMRAGKPVGTGNDTKSYARDGVTINVPSFQEGMEFASAPHFAALKKVDLDAFTVSVTASKEAKPGLMEMHLVDRTCAGHCKTDFRVLVVGK